MSTIRPTWQDWHNKSTALLESQAFKDYEKAISTFKESEEFKDYHLARTKMFYEDHQRYHSDNPIVDEEYLVWEQDFVIPDDLKNAHETWGVKIYRSMKYEIKQGEVG